MSDQDDRENNLVAAGALYALLSVRASPANVEIVTDEHGYPTNQIDITLSFMASPYRITVERVTPEPERDAYMWPAHWTGHDQPHDRGACHRCEMEAAWAELHDDCACLDHPWHRIDTGPPADPTPMWVCGGCLKVQGPAYAGGVP